MNNTTTKDTAEKAAGLLTSLLTGWGIPGGIARILTGAAIGAALAVASLLEQSCTARYSKTADGDIRYEASIIPVADEDVTK